MNQDDIDAAIGDLYFHVFNVVGLALNRVESQAGIYLLDRKEQQQELAQNVLNEVRRKVRQKAKVDAEQSKA